MWFQGKIPEGHWRELMPDNAKFLTKDMKATKEQFLRFRKLQNSGVINMNDITNGCKLSGLAQDVYEDIMHNYEEYLELYK